MTTLEFDSPRRDIYSVSRLTTEVRFALEQGFPPLWVEGEIGNLSAPSSGHLYFTLKDPAAQVRCALFRGTRMRLRFTPKEGDQVLVRARISLYEARGEFQLIVEQMEPAGEGALRRNLEALKQRLAAEGLFDLARKKPLPALPRRIGVLSSPSGAAVHDVLTVLGRRFPVAELILYPIPVQGAEAPAAIVEMLDIANRRAECDLLILTRGGGSLEDLMAFNDEGVVRTLTRLDLPLVSAIGHEIDFTLADLAADRRAPTPSAAAEMAAPHRDELEERIGQLRQNLGLRLHHRVDQSRHRLDAAAGRLRLCHPLRRLQQQAQRLDELGGRLPLAWGHRLHQARGALSTLEARLRILHPAQRLGRSRDALTALQGRLSQAMERHLASKAQALASNGRQLHTVSPLATLERGYAIAKRLPEGKILRDAGALRPGDRLQLQLAKGQVEAEVV